MNAQINTIYYDRFLQHIVESYTPLLKSAKDGHCMKITGLAMKELTRLLPMLRPINPNVSVYILSETENGDEYIHASKLIELRNDPEKSVLILVPSNSRTSAEDSYGDATFQNLSVAELQDSFLGSLINDIPQDKLHFWNQIWELLKEITVTKAALTNYVLYLELHDYSDEAWGNGLYLFGLVPDRELIKDASSIRRRFMINLEKVSSALGDFSVTASDRIMELPLKKNTKQRELMAYLTGEGDFDDSLSLFEDIEENHPEFNYAALPLNIDPKGNIFIRVDIQPGKDQKKELVKSDDGSYVINILQDKKGKISFKVITDPSPKDDPDIVAFEIAIIRVEDFSEWGVLKKTKVGKNKNGSRRMSVSLPFGMLEDGEYMLRVRAIDESGIVLPTKKTFREERVQESWEDAVEDNPNLNIDQYRMDNHVAYSNESEVFSVITSEETVDTSSTVDKRAKVDSITQALINYRISHLIKKEALEIPDDNIDRNAWKKGNLNNTYQFDFGTSYAYQIQLPKKLIQLERCFLDHEDQFGFVEAQLSANPTDIKLLDPTDTAIQTPKFASTTKVNIPDDLVALRQELFVLIKESATDGDENAGLTCTFDFAKNIAIVKNYLLSYTNWLNALADQDLDEESLAEVQNLDTVLLKVEMPDATGKFTNVKLITPLHPLRLAWIVNLYELYQDWEERTQEDFKRYKSAWYRKLDKLFQGELPLDVAPLVLTDKSLEQAYQYIGELTYGWGAYSQPLFAEENTFAGSYRQLKSYVSTLLNITQDKRIDSDVSAALVTRHLANYVLSHPYTNKLVINLFNAGDASVFAKALVTLEKIGLGGELSYEVRLFSDENVLMSGEAFRDLLDPESQLAEEAEVFSQASANRLFPKLRFSLNKIEEFINNHDKYQAHLSFLVNPFAVHTELVRPDELSRSFYLNGTICRDVIDSHREGKAWIWNRYVSNKVIPNPVNEFSNTEVNIFGKLQDATSKLLSTTQKESIPTTTLRLQEKDTMMIGFVHDCSDWVITFDKNMGPEFYDLPCTEKNDVPYLLDYVPGEETTGISSYLTARPTSEIAAFVVPLFKDYGIDLTQYDNFKEILEDIRSVSSSIIMQVNATKSKAFEVIGTTLCKRFLDKKHITKESFLIPIDLHKELFEDLDSQSKERADNLVVKMNPDKNEIVFTVVEIKCRNAVYQKDELHAKIVEQIQNTILALKSHFEIATDGHDRLDRELKTLELRTLLEFYIRRSLRYGQLDPNVAQSYLEFLSKLDDGYTLRFKQLGVIFDFQQNERQKKDFYGEAVVYTMGNPVITEILDKKSSLDTADLEDKDKEFVDFFEPTDVVTNVDSIELKKPQDEVQTHVDTVADGLSSQPIQTIESQPSVKFDEHEDDEKPVESETSSKPVAPVPTPEQEKSTTQPELQTTVEPPFQVEPKQPVAADPNYVKPSYDLMIGAGQETPQYGILGKMVSNGRKVALDLDGCNTISLFGVQGAGKSYTIGSVVEMTLKQFSNINVLPSPLAGVIFHYSDSMDYAPEFTSMVYPNDEAGQLAKLKAEYGAEPGSIKDVVLLAPESQVETRKAEYPDLEIHRIGFDSSELGVKEWMFLLGAMGNDSTYIKELKQIMKGCRNNMSLENIRKGVEDSPYMSTSQRTLATQKLDFASDYITDGVKLQQFMKPGRLIIVDLRDEFIEKDEALGLFVVMLNIFSNAKAVNGQKFNKFIVFDEAHKYMNNKDLVDSITTAIREMRHKGVSIMIASQDPMSLPTEIIELSSIVVLHRFSSPAWVKHVQKAITPLQTLTATEMAQLGSGEALVWASKATDKTVTMRPIKISIRPRATKHGGDTISAVNK